MGIPELEAKRYEGKVKDGNILISAHANSSARVTIAKDIFKSGGATDVSTGSEASAPDPAVRHPNSEGRAAQRHAEVTGDHVAGY